MVWISLLCHAYPTGITQTAVRYWPCCNSLLWRAHASNKGNKSKRHYLISCLLLPLLHLHAVECLHNRQQIKDNSTRDFTAYGGQYAQSMNPNDHGTSHLSVVDSQRGAVAMTTTVNTGFGSKVISSSTGLLVLALHSCTCTISIQDLGLALPVVLKSTASRPVWSIQQYIHHFVALLLLLVMVFVVCWQFQDCAMVKFVGDLGQ